MSIGTYVNRLVPVILGLLPLVLAHSLQADEPAAEPVRDRTRVPVPSLRAEPLLVRKLDAARDCIGAEAWVEASYLLQTLLETPHDSLVAVTRRDAGGAKSTHWVGIHGEAERLLASLPAAGRQAYDVRYAPRAQAQLAEAKRKGDVSQAAEVAQRYSPTSAGIEATALVGTYHLDRGRFSVAARAFSRLLEQRGADRLPPATWFRAALAFRRSGDMARAAQAWDRLATQSPGGLRLGERTVNLERLKRQLDGPSAVVPMAASVEDFPGLEPRWTQPTAHEKVTSLKIQDALDQHEGRSWPALPAFHPLPHDERVIYRSHQGLHALDPATGDEVWATPFNWAFDRMAVQRNYWVYLESWVASYLDYSPHALFENAVLGTLSSDGQRVFAVDDLPVPPYRNFRPSGRWRQNPAWPDFGAGLTEAAYHNRLLALDAATGKPLWEAGGFAEDPDDGELLGCYFLGPPLPLEGRLYGLIEKNNELILVCLNALTGDLVWKQPLAFASMRMLYDFGRRLQAVRPVHGQGVLVCPTNAGVVLGIDVLRPGFLWAYPYRTQALTQSLPYYERRGRSSPARAVAEWKAPATLIERGRVLFTAADEGSLHCLNLHDGSLQWKIERANEDLCLAGTFGDRALLLGKQSCRAVALADGAQLWKVETGIPSGLGVARGRVYYLPLRASRNGSGPTICAIDLDRGQIVGHVALPPKEVPGNLTFHNGELLSQSATGITAYTRAREKQKTDEETDDKDK